MTSDAPEASNPPHPRPKVFDERTVPAGQLDEKLGIQYLDYNPARTVATMPVAGNLQPYGLMHGGASAALAESIGSTCAVLNSDGAVCVGVQVLANHHRAARAGVVTAVARPVHSGRSLKTIAIEITNEDDELVCSAQLTAMALPKAPGARS
ncbi:PaaI family thioesterase [Blastococcus sp. Marseille-P5729]|uniref:PaaI family thioesterase n=1 Tax=Blastococcus sp. Marseille-P5729 TaxID=2086582 RepID=UPI000D0F4B58|nr:hotdog fold thioesterase [Blastococcus sp. Marseille-P5729]